MRLKIFGMLASTAVLLLSYSMWTTCQPSAWGQSQQASGPRMRSSSVDDPRLTRILLFIRFSVEMAHSHWTAEIGSTNRISTKWRTFESPGDKAFLLKRSATGFRSPCPKTGVNLPFHGKPLIRNCVNLVSSICQHRCGVWHFPAHLETLPLQPQGHAQTSKHWKESMFWSPPKSAEQDGCQRSAEPHRF